MPAASPYCTARTVEPVEDADGSSVVDEVVTILATFDEVVAFLERTYDWFSSFLIEQWAFEPEEARDKRESLGGFGVGLTNRWGSEVEVGVGRDVWFLHLWTPSPGRTFSDRPPLAGSLVFFLDGGHYTELEAGQLVSGPTCLAALREWLESDVFPGSGRRNPRTG